MLERFIVLRWKNAMWLCGNSSTNEIRKVTARLINTSFSVRAEYPEEAGISEKRVESRIPRVMPVAIFLGGDSENSIVIGFARDLSLEGIGLVTTRQVPQGELLLVIGERDQRAVLRAQCLQSRAIGFGCYRSGLKFSEALHGAKYSPLLEYVAFLEQAPVA